MEDIAEQLRRLVINQGLSLQASKETEKGLNWPLVKDYEKKNKHGVTRTVMNFFFSSAGSRPDIAPLDRLLACWSLLL